MTRYRPMDERRTPSFGRCILCLAPHPPETLSDEHVISLHLEGREVIEGAYCETCRAQSNKYESKAMYADLLVPRLLLGLKRARHKKRRGSPPRLPLAALGDTVDDIENADLAEFSVRLEASAYPPTMSLWRFPHAGKAVGIDRSGDLIGGSLWVRHIGHDWVPPSRAMATRTRADPFSYALMLAKIGYGHPVAELGLDGFDGTEIRDLLLDRRPDVFNFVGGDGVHMPPLSTRLHRLRLIRTPTRLSVLVQLFSYLQTPRYEVVLASRP